MFIRSLGNGSGKRTPLLQDAGFQGALAAKDTALWILVGGYKGEGDDRTPASGTSICDEADPLCLFAPWSHAEGSGTSFATPQVSAALDAVWAVWPDMDVLDLRNLAFDCAENMTAEGASGTERTFSYSNGRSFTSTTNSTWGHGILSLTCLFTPNGGLQNPVTGNAISGAIIGPLAGAVTGAAITGVDYTGRDFGYGFVRPVARENYVLVSFTQAATANLSAVQAISGEYALGGKLIEIGRFSVDLAVADSRGGAGNAIGVVSRWRIGGLTLQGGLATQPEGVGSLTGSRAFRAPATVSGAITAAYGRAFGAGLSAHLRADHWRTLATRGRSLWEGAAIRESRLALALAKRAGRHEFALQGVWRSGLSGSLDVDGRSWALSPRAEVGLWLTWRRGP